MRREGWPGFHGAVPVDLTGLLAVGAATMTAAAAQTISGFGMNLILAPAAQVLLPGVAAVRLVDGLGAILNSGLLLAGRRSVLWRPALFLVIPALATTLVLGPLVSGAGSRLLGVVVAAATVLAVAAAAWLQLPAVLTGTAGALIAGTLSGALNVSSGVSGPPVAVYAAAQPWTSRQLVVTAQAVFLPINLAAFIVLSAVPLPLDVTAAGAAGTVAGLLAGTPLRSRVSPILVRACVLAVAVAGAVLVLVRSLA